MRLRASILLTAVLTLVIAGTAVGAQATVGLGTAASFAVLAGTTITNTGATTITGDVGLQPGTKVTGFSTVTQHGARHLGDAVALHAKNNLVTAYNAAAGAKPVKNVAVELGGTTLKPGVYGSDTLGITGTLTLDGEGVYIFEAASTLITASNSRVALINGASACNVFWRVGSSATLATSTRFKGTIMALTSISMKTGAILTGRALARNGAVTLDHNVINSSSCTAPSPTGTSTGTPTGPTPTQPPTDTVAAAVPAPADAPVAPWLFLLVIPAALAWIWSIYFVARRSRPRG